MFPPPSTPPENTKDSPPAGPPRMARLGENPPPTPPQTPAPVAQPPYGTPPAGYPPQPGYAPAAPPAQSPYGAPPGGGPYGVPAAYSGAPGYGAQPVTPGYAAAQGSDASAGKSIVIGGMVAAALLLVGVLGAVLFFLVHVPIVPAPTAYQPYVAPDNAFACDAPDGWKRHETAAHSVQSGVSFKAGDAMVAINADLAGSLMGDVMRATGANAPDAAGASAAMNALPESMRGSLGAEMEEMRKPPVERLHEAGRHAMEGKYKHYVELPMETVTSHFGDGRRSEWTGEMDGLLTTAKMHGYRMTILTKDSRISVICRCPEGNWNMLKPAFDHIVDSMKDGPNS